MSFVCFYRKDKYQFLSAEEELFSNKQPRGKITRSHK